MPTFLHNLTALAFGAGAGAAATAAAAAFALQPALLGLPFHHHDEVANEVPPPPPPRGGRRGPRVATHVKGRLGPATAGSGAKPAAEPTPRALLRNRVFSSLPTS